MLRLAFVVLFLAFVIACSGDDEPDPTPAPQPTSTPTRTSTPEASSTPTPSPTPEPTPTPVPRPEANPFPPELQSLGLELLDQVAALRGIDDPGPVDMFLLTREQARDFYDTDEDAAPPQTGPTSTPGPPPLDPRQELYELLGLVPEAVQGTDTPTVADEELDNLISIITGFYAPAFNAFYMIETINGGIDGPLARGTIVHELTHALQYQEVDLNRIAGERGGNFDATTALLSVVEGDAVNSEIEVNGFSVRSTLRQPACFQIPPQRNPGTPYAIERELDVWYEDGLCFVQAVVAQDPGGIEGIFEDLPTTMEQVLHPEKYLSGETARPVEPRDIAAALPGDWTHVSSGTFGEFGLQNILLNGLPFETVRVQEGAAGWGGDAWDLYVNGDARLLHLETVWDAAAEAPEFRDTLVASLESLGFTSTTDGASTTLTRANVTWSVTLQEDRVTVLVANDSAVLDAASRALGAP